MNPLGRIRLMIFRTHVRTHHPLSSPPSRCLQSLLITQSHPPATPFPALQSTFGTSIPVSHFLEFSWPSSNGIFLRVNFEIPHLQRFRVSTSSLRSSHKTGLREDDGLEIGLRTQIGKEIRGIRRRKVNVRVGLEIFHVCIFGHVAC